MVQFAVKLGEIAVMRCFALSCPSALAHFTLYASAWLSFAAGAAEKATHLVFPVPGHPD